MKYCIVFEIAEEDNPYVQFELFEILFGGRADEYADKDGKIVLVVSQNQMDVFAERLHSVLQNY